MAARIAFVCALVLASCVPSTTAFFFGKGTLGKTTVTTSCPAPAPKVITAFTCKHSDGSLCSQCWGKCCLRDGNCQSDHCTTTNQVCGSTSLPFYWGASKACCIGNLNKLCGIKSFLLLGKKTCPSKVDQGQGSCVPINPLCALKSKFCLGTVKCLIPGLCGSWHGSSCIHNSGDQSYRVCGCGDGLPPLPPPGDDTGFPRYSPPPGDDTGFPRTSPPRPRNPRQPKAPKAPSEPKEPKAPKAPKEPKAPKAPEAPEEPPAPRRPRSRPPPPGDDIVRTQPPPPPRNTGDDCPDLEMHDRCTDANGGYCSKCLGKCCLEDGYCESDACNGFVDRDDGFCEWNKLNLLFKHSNCLGKKNLICNSVVGIVANKLNLCPASIRASGGVCVPVNAECGRISTGHHSGLLGGLFGGILGGKLGLIGGKVTGGKFSCLGTVRCLGGACADYHGAPCIYEGVNKLNKGFKADLLFNKFDLISWKLNLVTRKLDLVKDLTCADDFKVCGCPLNNQMLTGK